MTTPQESAEKDELEKFINSTINDFLETCYDGPVIPGDKATDFAMKVAAFSAKRAREKAIEECQAELKKHIHGDEYASDFTQGEDSGFECSIEYLEELKS